MDSMAPPLTASFGRETEGLCTNSQTAIAAQALSGITNNVVTVASGGSVEDYAVGDTVVISSMDSGTCAVAGTYYYVKAVSASARTIEVTATLSSSAHANCQIERSALSQVWYGAEDPQGGVTPGGTADCADGCECSDDVARQWSKRYRSLCADERWRVDAHLHGDSVYCG